MVNSIQQKCPKGRSDKVPYHLRAAIAAMLATFVLVVFSGPALAGSAGTIQFNIPAQPLSSGVIEFSLQANVQVLTAGSRLQGVNTRGVNGSFSVTAGIKHLLAGTGFGYHLVGNDTISLIPPLGRKVNLDGPRKAQPETAARPDEDAHAASPGDGSRTGDNKSSNPPALQAIVVTAQKYQQRAFDVPISLDVITGSELQAHAVTNLINLQYEVPGLYVMNTGTNHAVYLRGVGNYFGNSALVGQYINDADITDATAGAAGYATGDVALYDLNRVEVLRGPQGTLYGDGSIGGVVRYITNAPVLDRFQANADVAALFTEYGAPGQRIQAALNVPLIADTLGLRLAGQFEHDGGWMDEPAANLKNINGGDLVDVRAEGLWQPTSRLKVNAMQIVHRHTEGISAGEDASGNFTPLFDTTLTPTQEDNSNVSNVTMNYDFTSVRLLSSSTYFKEEQDISNEMTPYTTPAFTFWYLYPHFNTKNEGSSEELRLSNTEGGPWHWVMGGFYKHFLNQTSGSIYFGVPGPLSAATSFTEDYGGSSTSYAGFVNSSYNIRRLTVGAGVRYFKDRESSYGVGFPLRIANFTSTSPRFYAQYRATPFINVYASASKGFRSGGFNAPGLPPYRPETLWSYDLGTKVRSPRFGIRGDVDLFYSDYAKYDVEGFFPPNYEIQNAGRARIEGVDADITYQPTGLWQLSLNAELLKTELLSLGSAVNTGFAAGDRLPFAPKYSVTASVQRDFRVNRRPAYAEVYYYELSRVQYRESGLPVLQSDVLHFLNFRIGVHWTDTLTLELFAHNLLNDRGELSPFGELEGASARPRPRTLGVDFRVELGGS